MEDNGIPPRPKKKKDFWKYFEQNKEAIVSDYDAMRLADFLEKWHMSTVTCGKLKQAWGIGKKRRRVVKEDIDQGGDSPVDVALSQRDHYLILLGYQQAVREILGRHE